MRRAAVALFCVAQSPGCLALDLDYETGCPPGHLRIGDACRRLDDCADDAVPILGGGCERAGVTTCGLIGVPFDGGCDLFVPDDVCELGSFYGGLVGQCVPVSACPDEGWPQEDSVSFPNVVRVDCSPRGASDAYPSLAAALEVPGDEPLTIRIEEGTCNESVTVARRVQIVGRCPARTAISPLDGPALTFAAGSEGSFVHDLAVVGGRDGLRVERGDLRIERLHFHGMQGAGIVLDDATAVTEVSQSLFENLGTAIEVRGSKVSIADVEIRNTTGPGIAAHPSRWAAHGAGWDPRLSTSSVLALRTALVDGTRGAGILIEGSEASIEDCIVRNVTPHLAPGSIWQGIAVAWRPTGAVPAQLSLTRSAVIGPFEVGVDAWNARVDLDQVVIDGARDCAGRGLGLRLRNDLATDQSVLEGSSLRNALVKDVAVSGLRVEGGELDVHHSLLRGVGRHCSDSGDVGDGASVIDHRGACPACEPFPAARLSISSSRIDASTRAGIAAFGEASVTVNSSLLACNARGIVGAPPQGTLCRCDDSLGLCPSDSEPLPAPLGGSSSCDPTDSATCAHWRFGPHNFAGSWRDGVAVRVLEPTGVVPMLTDACGGFELEGIYPPTQTKVLQLATYPGWVARSHAFVSGYADERFVWTANLPQFDTVDFLQGLGVDPAAFDLSRGFVEVHLCPRPVAPTWRGLSSVLEDEQCFDASFHPDYCPPDLGIPGATVELEPLPDGEPDSAAVVYWTKSNGPAPLLTATEGQAIDILGVRPGYRWIRIELPEAPKLNCTADLRNGFEAGWEFEQFGRTVRVAIPVFEARFSAGTYVICSEEG